MLDKEAFFQESKEIVERLAPCRHATVLALHGDLGAGKTTFTQCVARELGVVETVTSPTFVIMKSYATTDSRFKTLVHIDAYRLKASHELEILGWARLIDDPHTLICLEWPERIADILPIDAIHITFTFVDEEHRAIEITS